MHDGVLGIHEIGVSQRFYMEECGSLGLALVSVAVTVTVGVAVWFSTLWWWVGESLISLEPLKLSCCRMMD